MPAPRLLDKKLIQVSLAAERRQEVERGVKLARSIDALQVQKGLVEQDLDSLRTKTLSAIQQEINQKIAENELLSQRNITLKEERIRLEAPVDLTEAWTEVKSLKQAQDESRNELLVREIEVSKRENDVHDLSNDLQKRESSVSKKEKETRENLTAAEEELDDASRIKNEAQAKLSTLEHEISSTKAHFAEKDRAYGDREAVILQKEHTIEEELLDITNQKIYLADQRATLERGFAELRRKQQR